MMGTSSFIQWNQVCISVYSTASVINHNKVNVFYEDLLSTGNWCLATQKINNQYRKILYL